MSTTTTQTPHYRVMRATRLSTRPANLPWPYGGALGLKLGDVGIAFWRRKASGKVASAFFIYGDKGNPNNLGEGSMAMAKLLAINPDPNHGGYVTKDVIDMGKGILHIGFPGSGTAFLDHKNADGSSLAPHGFASIARELWTAFTNLQ